MDIDTQTIANPFNTAEVMALTRATCQDNPRLGIALVNGRQVACWGADTDGSVWLVVNGKNHHITNEQLATNATQYRTKNTEIPWQTMVEIQKGYQVPQTPYTPPTTTFYYGSGGNYVGRSTTW